MRRAKRYQSGAALILSLLMLLILTLLAVSGMQGTVMQERMVSAQRDGLLSFEIAEAALRDGEAFLENSVNTLNSFNGSGGLYAQGAAPDPSLPATWAGTASRTGTAVAGVTPRYFIEYIGEAQQPDKLTNIVAQGYSHETGAITAQAFRVVAWSPGVSGEAQRIIESYYSRQL